MKWLSVLKWLSASLVLLSCAAPPQRSANESDMLSTPTAVPSLPSSLGVVPGVTQTLLISPTTSRVVDALSNPDLYAALTLATDQTQKLGSFRETFTLRHLARATGQNTTTTSMNLETVAHASGSRLFRMAAAQSLGADQAHITQTLFIISGGVFYKPELLDQQRCTQLLDELAVETIAGQMVTAGEMAELMVSNVKTFTLSARNVNVGQFVADQYTFDSSLSFQEGGSSAVTSISRGHIFFSPVLSVVVQQAGTIQGRIRAASYSLDGDFSWQYTLEPVSGGELLSLPAECDFTRSKQIPVLPKGMLVLRSAQGVEFFTTDAPEAVIAYYQQALSADGWQLDYHERLSAQAQRVKYSRTDEALFLNIIERTIEGEKMLFVTLYLT